MRVLRLVPMFVLFLVLSGGQTILMLDETNAACCNIYKPGCTSWSGLVYGTLEIQKDGAKVTTESGASKVLALAQDVRKEFSDEKIDNDYGFIVVSPATGTPTIIAFVPIDMNHTKKEDKDNPKKELRNAAQALKEYNQLFEMFAAVGQSRK